MLPDIYLTGSYLKYSEPGPLRKQPRDYFTNFYADLLALKNRDLDHESLFLGDQLNFSELGDLLFQDLDLQKVLKEAQLLTCAFWSHEFDQDHACGAYFVEKYQLSAKVTDLTDCGNLSPFLGMNCVPPAKLRKPIKYIFIFVHVAIDTVSGRFLRIFGHPNQPAYFKF